MLRRIFGTKRDEMLGGYRNLRNEKLQKLFYMPGNIRLIKARMRWAGHVACMGRE